MGIVTILLLMASVPLFLIFKVYDISCPGNTVKGWGGLETAFMEFIAINPSGSGI